MDANDTVYKKLTGKSLLINKIHKNTSEVFQELKSEVAEITRDFQNRLNSDGLDLNLEFKDKENHEIELIFASDMLVFSLHTNVFEFSRVHEVKKTPYIVSDPERSFCGLITIFNFLSDSYRLNRFNDAGYLVARVFVNKDKFFLVEGKHQTGFYHNQFMPAPINKKDLRQIIESAMSYCIDFDLLVPPYDLVKETTVGNILESSFNNRMKTSKRMGFKFQADHDQQNNGEISRS